MAECKAYRYAKNNQISCSLIDRNLIEESGQSVFTDDDGQVYKKSKLKCH